MIALAGVTRAVAAMYEAEASELDWLEGVRQAVGTAFGGHIDAQAFTLDIDEQHKVSFRNVAGGAPHTDLMQALYEVAEPDDVRNSFLSGPLLRLSQVIGRSRTEKFRAVAARNMNTAHAVDVIGLMGVDSSGAGVALSFVLPGGPISPQTRSVLSKFSAHMTTAFRLRRSSAQVAAKLELTGELCEAQDFETERFAAELRKAALGIDRANRQAALQPETALASWKALVEGRWSLVLRLGTDGRKLLVAQENPPQTRPLAALTRKEQLVISLIAVGHPAKVVAYELGYAEPTVSLYLKSALEKLGFRNRQELIEVHGVFFGRDGER